MDFLNWLKIEVLFEPKSSLEDRDEEDETLKEIRFKNNGVENYEKGFDYIGPEDPVINLAQGCLVPKKGKKIYYTIVTLKSGNCHYAIGKSEDVYKLIDEYEYQFELANKKAQN